MLCVGSVENAASAASANAKSPLINTGLEAGILEGTSSGFPVDDTPGRPKGSNVKDLLSGGG
jgi:hypothetical protein